jgi:hypothetical protein
MDIFQNRINGQIAGNDNGKWTVVHLDYVDDYIDNVNKTVGIVFKKTGGKVHGAGARKVTQPISHFCAQQTFDIVNTTAQQMATKSSFLDSLSFFCACVWICRTRMDRSCGRRHIDAQLKVNHVARPKSLSQCIEQTRLKHWFANITFTITPFELNRSQKQRVADVSNKTEGKRI